MLPHIRPHQNQEKKNIDKRTNTFKTLRHCLQNIWMCLSILLATGLFFSYHDLLFFDEWLHFCKLIELNIFI